MPLYRPTPIKPLQTDEDAIKVVLLCALNGIFIQCFLLHNARSNTKGKYNYLVLLLASKESLCHHSHPTQAQERKTPKYVL